MNTRNYTLKKLNSPEFDEDSLIYIDDYTLGYNSGVRQSVIDDIKSNNIQIYDGTYRYDEKTRQTTIYLFGRGKESGRITLKIENFYPYYWEHSTVKDAIDKDGKPVEKIIVKSYPKRVREIKEKKLRRGREEDVPLEADIPFVERFRIDMYDFFKSKEIINPRVCIFDVETNHPVNDDLISLSYSIDWGEIKHINIRNNEHFEEDMMKFWAELRDINFIISYNKPYLSKKKEQNFDEEKIKTFFTKYHKYYQQVKNAFKIEGKKLFNYDELILTLSLRLKYFSPSEAKRIIKLLQLADVIKIEDNEVSLNDYELDFFGFIFLDYLPIVKKMIRKDLPNYKLETVCNFILGEGKAKEPDVWPRELDDEKLRIYNDQDVKLLIDLEEAIGAFEYHIFANWWNQINIFDTIELFRLNDYVLLRECHNWGIVLPSKIRRKRRDYSAADPFAMPGFYRDILAYDVKSMYASIVIALNASPITKREDGEIVAANGIRFTRDKNVFVETLKTFLKQREEYKQLLRSSKHGTKEWRRYNHIQLILKDQAASFYGMYGYSSSRVKDEDIAEAITSTAREILGVIKESADKLGLEVVYMHSVTPDTPILIKYNNIIDIINISELEEYKDLTKIQIWSDRGWTKIKKLIKHKVNEDIYRTITRKGIVTTTEHHSLLTSDANPVTPHELHIGDKLLINKLPKSTRKHKDINKNLAWLYGFFIAEGSCGVYNTRYGTKYIWKIDNQDWNLLNKALEIMRSEFKIDGKILDTMRSSNVYRLVPHKSDTELTPLRDMFVNFMDFYDEYGNKRIPAEILNSNRNIMREFLRGYNAGDGANYDDYKSEFIEFKTKSQILALGLTYLLENLGLDYNLNVEERKKGKSYYNIYINSEKNPMLNHWKRLQDNEIKKIYKLENDYEYVYDIETENHHFHAGVGELIVHNTDSAYIIGKKELGNIILKHLNNNLKQFAERRGFLISPIIDFKGYFPKGYIHSKARNSLMDEEGNIYTTGMPTIRIETPTWVSKIMDHLIRMKLNDVPNSKCIDFIKDAVNNINKVKPGDLGVNMPLKKPISDYKNNAYHILALKNSSKYYGFKINVGQRFKILPVKNAPFRDIAFLDNEFPEGVEIDYEQYLDRQLWNKIAPIVDLEPDVLKKKITNKGLFEYE